MHAGTRFLPLEAPPGAVQVALGGHRDRARRGRIDGADEFQRVGLPDGGEGAEQGEPAVRGPLHPALARLWKAATSRQPLTTVSNWSN